MTTITVQCRRFSRQRRFYDEKCQPNRFAFQRRKPGNNLEGEFVSVFVGSELPAAFTIHEGLLRDSSGFFDKALEGTSKEAQERVVKLPEDGPAIFTLFHHWLYFGTFPSKKDGTARESNVEYLQLAKAYVLGDKIQAGHFCDAIVDAIIEKARATNYFPGSDVIQYFYSNTLPSSNARKVFVAFYAFRGSMKWLDHWTCRQNVPREFLFDLAELFYSKHSSTDPTDRAKTSSSCVYHRHGSGICYTSRGHRK